MADSAEARVLEFTRCAAGADLALHGVVRVAVPEGIDSELLVPELGRLQARFPGVVLELAASNAVVNLARHEADLALRFVRPKGGDLVARRVGTLRSGVFGLHAHVQRGVGRAHWVVCTEAFRSPPEARWYERNVPEGNVRLRCNRLEALMAAARCGVGLAVLPEALAARDASLERCTDGEVPPEAPLWLVGHRELLRVPRVRAVWKFLIETVGRLLE